MRVSGLPAILAVVAMGLSTIGVGLGTPVASAASLQPHGAPVGTSQWNGPSTCGVPGNVTAPANAAFAQIAISAGGGGDGGAAASAQGYGGLGGPGAIVRAEFAVHGGEVLGAIAGCQGQSAPQGSGVVGTGGTGGAGWTAGGAGGNGYYCSGLCSASIQGNDGSGGGGGGSTAVCVGLCPSGELSSNPLTLINQDPPTSLLMVAGGGGGGGETMCAGTHGGGGGFGGIGVSASDLSQVGEGPGGAGGGDGGTGGDSGGSGGVNSTTLAPVMHGAPPSGGAGGNGAHPNFGDSAGSGGGGGGLVGGAGAPAGTTDCGAGGGGGGGSSWASGSAINPQFGSFGGLGNGVVRVTFLEAAPPTATISSPASGGGYAINQDVATSFSCAEGQGGSGLKSCTDSNGSISGSGHLNTSTPGQHTYSVLAVSYDGQVGKASLSYQVFMPPTAQIVNPGNGGTYVVGQSVATSFSCGDVNASPLASCVDSNGAVASTTVTNGLSGHGALNTRQPGTFTYTVTATAHDGQKATTSISYTVTQSRTTTAVAASANPSVVGQRVTYTAAVAPVAPGAGTPTGSVTFSGNGQVLCSAVPLASGGTATCQHTYTSPGDPGVTATYSGDTNLLGSHGSLTQQVTQAHTTTTVTASANPSIFGAPVIYTASVAPVAPGAGTPTGTVTFTAGGVTLGAQTLSSKGTASVSAADLPAGPQTITATYSGDVNFQGSAGSLQQQVSYIFRLGEPADHRGVVRVPSTLPVSFTLTDAQGKAVVDATATLDVNGGPSATGVGYSRGTDRFVYSGGAYRYLLKITQADVVDGHVTLTIHVSDGTTQRIVLAVR